MHTEAAEASPNTPAPETPPRTEHPEAPATPTAAPDAPATPPHAADPDGPETSRAADPDGPETSPSAADPESPGTSRAADPVGVEVSSQAADLDGPETPLSTAGPDGPGTLRPADPDGTPLFSRALLALTAAATIAVSPIAAAAIGPAGSGQSAHSVPVYLISRISHDVGHNDWAFQGQDAGRVSWVITYASLALLWLGVSLWIRTRMRRADAPEPRRVRLWLRVLIAAWAAELVTGSLTLAAGAYAEWTSTPIGADVLKAADLCTPWWSCAAAVLVASRAERNSTALRAIAAYAAVLITVLMLPLPGPDVLKALLIALPAAVPALLTQRQQIGPDTDATTPATQSAIATS